MTEYGQLSCRKFEDPQAGVTFTAEWQGPATILISPELMDDHDERAMQVEGDILTICQFKARITGRTVGGDYIAERIDAVE
jgi:hypothetical protein